LFIFVIISHFFRALSLCLIHIMFKLRCVLVAFTAPLFCFQTSRSFSYILSVLLSFFSKRFIFFFCIQPFFIPCVTLHFSSFCLYVHLTY
jgi:hypothetical protein